ncbi:Similar to SNAPC3: snRNA-activating protein complex subunit 3 (Homo sapiens) [Cotesia congregata]|uniref:snRNA-activating protein complex subunit 3 n=1 Tax=Cotesia congregata TaxID=51543 RepID=A0A8J2MSE4_COTCN|nr:Similar to SNAPC3: snRNA-activating protein complex subunit 3 (Homo sapiens) [Cotesia congregata]
MEHIYQSYTANASSKLNIAEYFSQFEGANEQLRTNIPMNKAQLTELHESISIDKLDVDEESAVTGHRRMIPKLEAKKLINDTNLQTLKLLKEKYMEYLPKIFRPSLKYQSELIVRYSEPIMSGPGAVPGKNMIIFIRVYNPFDYHRKEYPVRHQRISLMHLIGVLDCQTLADLRDKIHCISDLSLSRESSGNPQEYTEVSNKDLYKSSFFYIENTFYNDTRDPTNHDNSLPIREWAEKRNLGPFNVAKMEDTTLGSLVVKFGYPWVYQHQGNCEHLIVFSDARFVARDDDLAIANYPRIYRAKPSKQPSCMICERIVQWVTFDSDRVPHDSFFFCDKCFLSFNYKDNKKIGNFKAYRWPYDPELMKMINNFKSE